MTREARRTWHFALHVALDQLVAAYLVQHKDSLTSTITVMELLAWSHAQTIQPTFRCSRCGFVSHNPNDAEQRYCGACHAFLDDPSPNIPC